MSQHNPIERDLIASGISEKDLEIEHLQTQLVALTQKAIVVEDIQKDVEAGKEMLADSQNQRGVLQESLREAAEEMRLKSEESMVEQRKLIEEN